MQSVCTMKHTRRLLLALALLAPPAARAQSTQDLDAYIQKALADWQGAGVAIAVVKNDSIVFAKGYGVREAGKPEPVTVHSLFAIGSNSKLFTAVAAGIAVDEGKLKWGDRVTEHLPWFEMYDPYVTREITIRDMLSHNSGLGRRGDALWYGTTYSRQEILRRVRYLKPIASFRAEYGYQNIMVLGAGEATAAAMGTSWDDLIKTKIFGPLGMTESNTSIRDFKPGQDVAQPHTWRDGKPIPIPYLNIDNVGPAGSINSNVLDMAQWLRMLLAGGKFGGKQIISAESLREIEAAHTITGNPSDSLTHFSAYGLGVGMRDYRGLKMLSHTGGIDGMLSAVNFIPERGLGVVVLTNTAGHNGVYTAVASRAIDTYLGVPLRDASATALAQARKSEANQGEEARKLAAARVQGTSTLPLDRYAGTYSNDMYGDVTVAVENGALVLRASFTPKLGGRLEHWHYDVFRIVDPEGSGDRDFVRVQSFVRFETDARAQVPSVTLNLGEPTEFHRKMAPGTGGRRASR